MKFRKIKSVTICGVRHKVKYLGDYFTANSTHFGEINYDTAVIKINNGAADDIKSETLWHEILHGALVHTGYDELSSDEAFITRLSAVLNSIEVEEDEEQDVEIGVMKND